ncbi:MAG: YggT family protein [Verrucomicrobiae bacterium]|nr:YggT family protein [Verrucomicrobiae bacterium]
MGLINILFDLCFLTLLVRAVVPNEGHLAFNRPYQSIIGLVDALRKRLKVPERQVGQLSWLVLLVLIGARGILWWVFGTHELDFKVIVINAARANLLQSQVLSVIAAIVFLLQVYAFITLAILIGKLENRTDHYARLMRALLGPLKQVKPPIRCLIPALALVLFWTVALWMFAMTGITPGHRFGIAGCVLGSIPITLALIIDLARVWIFLLIVRSVFSFIQIWRPPIVDVIERITDPVLKPFHRLRLKAGRFDLTPVVSILALAILYQVLIDGLPSPVKRIPDLTPPLKWLYEQS